MSNIASIDDQGVVISSMPIDTTDVCSRAFISYLKTAIVKRHQAIILAIEHSAICHLISMTASGQLYLLESMPSIRRPDVEYPTDWHKAMTSATETDIEGQYVLAGYKWIRMMTVILD